MRRLLALLFPLLLFLLSSASQAELAVVAGKNSPIEKLDGREVADIFLAKITRLADGQRVTPLELRDSTFRASFYRGIAGKTLPQINSYWTALIFTGKGKPPRSIDEIDRLMELLANDPHAITYLPLDQVSKATKVLYVFR